MAAVKSLLATEGQSRSVMEEEAAFGLLFLTVRKKNEIEKIFSLYVQRHFWKVRMLWLVNTKKACFRFKEKYL